METLAVWLSEWVADLPRPELERRWLELQTISIPLDGGLETSDSARSQRGSVTRERTRTGDERREGDTNGADGERPGVCSGEQLFIGMNQ